MVELVCWSLGFDLSLKRSGGKPTEKMVLQKIVWVVVG